MNPKAERSLHVSLNGEMAARISLGHDGDEVFNNSLRPVWTVPGHETLAKREHDLTRDLIEDPASTDHGGYQWPALALPSIESRDLQR
jgi:hypothetical protein